MPKRSKIATQVPKPIVEEVNARLINSAFSDLDNLADWLNEKLVEHGLEITISRSGLGRHSVQLRKKWEQDDAKKRQFLEFAKASVEANQDAETVLNEYLRQKVYTRMLRINDIIEDLEDTEEDLNPEQLVNLVMKLAKALKDLGQQGISSQKFKDEIKQRIVQAEKAAEKQAIKQGLSDEDWAAIRANFLGVDVE
jgi:hypothetical protein